MKQCSINTINSGSERSIERSLLDSRDVETIYGVIFSNGGKYRDVPIITIIGCKIEMNGSRERYRDS